MKENDNKWINQVEYETMTEEERILSNYTEKLIDGNNYENHDREVTELSIAFNPATMIGDGEGHADDA
eukprot:518308-Ditylum_brightwellii.AAC.1